MATIGYVAFLAGPPLIGFLGEHIGLLGALLVVFVFIIAAGLASGAARETGAAAETLRKRRAGRGDGGDHGVAGDQQPDARQHDGGESRLQTDRPHHGTDDTMADPAASGGTRTDR